MFWSKHLEWLHVKYLVSIFTADCHIKWLVYGSCTLVLCVASAYQRFVLGIYIRQTVKWTVRPNYHDHADIVGSWFRSFTNLIRLISTPFDHTADFSTFATGPLNLNYVSHVVWFHFA